MASSARKMAANTIKKIHVPAYWPVVSGVQFTENSGVVEEKKNVMAIESMPIMVDMGIEELVELPMAMPDIVLVAGMDMDMDMGPIEFIVDVYFIVESSKRWDETVTSQDVSRCGIAETCIHSRCAPTPEPSLWHVNRC